ncbi:MAG: purine-nucleoside phosphorylase [Candidatus Paceibacterota bacterium]
MTNQVCENDARLASEYITKHFGPAATADLGIVLGTGWGDSLALSSETGLALRQIPGFKFLGELHGHDRKLIHTKIMDRNVWVLKGRIHLNESPFGEHVPRMVRLQIETLIKLGVRNLIITNAVGSLVEHISVGDVVIVNGFVTVFAPPMPLWVGEFCSPEDALDGQFQNIAERAGRDTIQTHRGGLVMLRGPFFEGRALDKKLLLKSGAVVVGMSMLPEACIASLYGVRVLGLSFVTNDAVEEHSHEDNISRAKAHSMRLGEFLEKIVAAIPGR